MKVFVYKAKDAKTGKIVKGNVQAETEMSAGRVLIDQGYSQLL